MGKPDAAIRKRSSTLSEKTENAANKAVSQPLSERQRKESESPIILVNQASSATLVEETISKESNFFSPSMFG